MKTKKVSQKLTLNKKTVSDLGNREMGRVQGGGSLIPRLCCETLFTCPLLVTDEFHTCDCTYYCTDPGAGCPSAA